MKWLFSGGDDTGEFTAPALREGDSTVYLSEEGVIPTATYVEAGVYPRTPLAHNDGPGLNRCPAGSLDA
jgi:hypothetical protein